MKRMILLAAGEGQRLRPLTEDRPKCMVEVHGRPILHWQLDSARAAGVEEIVIVCGYRKDAITIPDRSGVTLVENPKFATTNMVRSLWSAEKYFGDEFILSYGDIVCSPSVFRSVFASSAPISVVVDQRWESYWSQRFEDVLSDAESLRISTDGNLLEVGQKAKSISEIEAQYIGVVGFRREGIAHARRLYEAEEQAYALGQFRCSQLRNLDRLYMTDFLQGLIRDGVAVKAVPIQRNWVEIDSIPDLKLAEKVCKVDEHRLAIES